MTELSRWVTIATYPIPGDARVALATLEGAGVEARLLDENVAGMLAHMSIALGGIRLQVPADREQDARSILGDPPDFDEADLAAQAEAADEPETDEPGADPHPIRGKVAFVLLGLFAFLILSAILGIFLRTSG